MIDLVNNTIQRLVDLDKYPDIRAGWTDFLGWLRARRGADLESTMPAMDIERVERDIEGGALERLFGDDLDDVDADLVWVQQFDSRPDVLRALRRFLQERDLTRFLIEQE